MKVLNNSRVCSVVVTAIVCMCVSSGYANLLPADTFEWPLANPNNEYESVSFSPNTAIPELGGWRINTSTTYAESYKVRGNVGVVFPIAEAGTGTYYATLGSYIANNTFVLYNPGVANLEAGKTYTLSGFVSSAYGAGTNSGVWRVEVGVDPSYTAVTGDLSQLARGTWTPFSFDFTTETGSAWLGVGFNKTDGNHARVLFDGLTLVEVPEPITLVTLLAGTLLVSRRRA